MRLVCIKQKIIAQSAKPVEGQVYKTKPGINGIDIMATTLETTCM